MKYTFPVFSLLFSILLMSCTSEERISCQKLEAENQLLRDSLAMFQQFSTMKSEAIVELEKMNIVYRGVENHVKIAVPNALKFSVAAPGLKLIENGHYVLRPTTGNEVTFRIVAEMRTGEQLKFEKVFRIENIGEPIGIIKGESIDHTMLKMSKKELIESTVSFDIYNFPHFRNLQVASFKIHFPNNKIIEISGNTLNQKAFKAVEELKIGDRIYVNEIKGLGYSGGRLKRIRPFYIEIKD